MTLAISWFSYSFSDWFREDVNKFWVDWSREGDTGWILEEDKDICGDSTGWSRGDDKDILEDDKDILGGDKDILGGDCGLGGGTGWSLEGDCGLGGGTGWSLEGDKDILGGDWGLGGGTGWNLEGDKDKIFLEDDKRFWDTENLEGDWGLGGGTGWTFGDKGRRVKVGACWLSWSLGGDKGLKDNIFGDKLFREDNTFGDKGLKDNIFGDKLFREGSTFGDILFREGNTFGDKLFLEGNILVDNKFGDNVFGRREDNAFCIREGDTGRKSEVLFCLIKSQCCFNKLYWLSEENLTLVIGLICGRLANLSHRSLLVSILYVKSKNK